MKIIDSRKFVGMAFGITVSASNLSEDESVSTEDYVNRLMFQESGHILREGGKLVLGHRWKLGGVMHHLAARARDLGKWRGDYFNQPAAPSIINLLAWPDQPPKDDSTATDLIEAGILEIRQVEAEGIDTSAISPRSDEAVFCRCRSLTAMRKQLTQLTDVQLCLGGGKNKPERRLPGVLEEAILTIRASKPLYLASALGGVSKLIADALLRRRISPSDTEHFATPDPARRVMEQYRDTYPYPVDEGPSVLNGNSPDTWNALAFLHSQDISHLADNARLSPDEFITLLSTADINRALMMFTLGATRVYQAKKK